MSRSIWDLPGPGWRADCRKCVGSKFTCDEHYYAASGIEAPSGVETGNTDSTEGESPAPEGGDAQ